MEGEITLDDFEALYRGEYGAVRASVREVVRSAAEADDVTQVAFVHLWRREQKRPVKPNPKAYLYKTAKNLALYSLREQKRQERLVESAGVPIRAELAQGRPLSQDQALFPAEFDAAMRSLGREALQAFAACELRGLTAREAGPLLGVDYTTAFRRTEAARTSIREELTA